MVDLRMLGFSLPVPTEITAVSEVHLMMGSEQKEHLLSHSFHSTPFHHISSSAVGWFAAPRSSSPWEGDELSSAQRERPTLHVAIWLQFSIEARQVRAGYN